MSTTPAALEALEKLSHEKWVEIEGENLVKSQGHFTHTALAHQFTTPLMQDQETFHALCIKPVAHNTKTHLCQAVMNRGAAHKIFQELNLPFKVEGVGRA